MPFESLSERINMAIRRLSGRGRINENDIEEMMKEVRVSLLEADVNYKVVKSFIKDVKEKALGERVMRSLTPGDQVLKIVRDELQVLMGKEAVPLNMNLNGTTVILLAGLLSTSHISFSVSFNINSSITAPVSSFTPIILAGITFVSFKTKISPLSK